MYISHKPTTLRPTTYDTKTGETYYLVEFRMYLYFDKTEIVVPDCYYNGSIFAPYAAVEFKQIDIPVRPMIQQHTFAISERHIEDFIDRHVGHHINRYKDSPIWKYYEEQLVEKYIEDIKKQYGVELDKSYVSYTKSFVWEVL